MKKNRIIAKLDIKSDNVVKGIQFECLRVMGKPHDLVQEYFLQGADELIYIDTVANLYQRDNLINIVDKTTENVNIPITVGGGIRTIEDIKKLLQAGADKVAINTAATKNPELIRDAAKVFGSQCIVLSIEAKQSSPEKWEAYTDNGREKTGLDVVSWAKKGEELGAGEILLTSVDQDGTESGFDYELIKKVTEVVSIPVIACGGAGSAEDIKHCFQECKPDAVALASLLHYKETGISEIKEILSKNNIPVRVIQDAKRVEKVEQDFISNYNRFTLSHLQEKAEFVKTPIKKINPTSSSDFDVGIINYGINNIKSVAKAFLKLGKKVKIIETPENIKKAKLLVLPGVGAFEHGMRALEEKKLADAIKSEVANGKPIMGICLGMQLLFTESFEFGLHKGLDIIPGKVVALKQPSLVNLPDYRVPHVGWNDIILSNNNNLKKDCWKKTLLEGVPENSSVYFVHSYYAVPDNKEDIISVISYGDQDICVVIKHKNINATQFHPEKSGTVGLKMLENFCRLNGC